MEARSKSLVAIFAITAIIAGISLLYSENYSLPEAVVTCVLAVLLIGWGLLGVCAILPEKRRKKVR